MEIDSERLVLVAMGPDECAAVVAGRRDGREWAADYPTEGDVDAASMDASPPPWLRFQIRERASGLAIGGVGFHGSPDDRGEVEIGYGLAPSARGMGLATEAVTALLSYARDHGARAVIARTEPGNAASAAVLRRCGFLRVRVADGPDDHDVFRHVL